jgi:ribosome assembly protein 1
VRLQYEPQHIRNISIVAHVDHGKTTLADRLISANGIISKKMAGELKYMDDRIDEQNRGITMKSSSISLLAQHNQQEHLINLIDSPGHVEFGFEVSAALRLTDGALVVVDVLEGVSSQTYRVLLQTFEERVASILVLNKIDKLIRETQLSPLEAYRHLNQIIEQVNAILGSFINCRTIGLSDTKISMHTKKSSREYSESELQEKQMDELEN